jgi:hypothetical protein
LFASPTATGTWNGLSYTIYSPIVNNQPPVSLYGTSPANGQAWDAGGVYSPGTGLPSSFVSFNSYLPGTSYVAGDYTRVQFSSGVTFRTVSIGLKGTNYNPMDTLAVYGSNTGTAPWTQLFIGSSGLTVSNYNVGSAQFFTFTFTTTGSFTNYIFQIPTILPGFGNGPVTGCLYWTT